MALSHPVFSDDSHPADRAGSVWHGLAEMGAVGGIDPGGCLYIAEPVPIAPVGSKSGVLQLEYSGGNGMYHSRTYPIG